MNGNKRPTQIDNRGRTEPELGSLDQLAAVSGDERPRRPSAAPPQRRRRWPWVLVLLLVVIVAGAWSQRQTIRSWLPQTQFNQLLERADAALVAGRLDGHAGDSARELYSAARALRPTSARAREGLDKVGAAELDQARQALAAGDLEQAAASLRLARALLGGGSQLDSLDAELARHRARGEKLETLLERAAQALTDGNINGKQGAAALYQQALIASPGNAIARHGLDKVGAAMAANVREAIGNGELEAAADVVQRLQRLLPDSASLPPLRAALSEAREQAAQRRQQVLSAAAGDLTAGRLAGAGSDNAAARYQQLLDANPDDAAARAGLARVATALVQRANQRMDDDRLDAAARLLDQAGRITDSDNPALVAARQRWSGLDAQPKAPPPLTEAQRAEVQKLLTRASAAAESGKLMLPPGNSAYDLYRSALAIDAGNADAMSGLASLPGQARRLFDQALKQGDTARADKLLKAFAELAPGSAALADMRARLQAARGS